MNRLCIVGRVIADPESRRLGDRLVATVPISVNRPYRRKEAAYPDSDVFRVEIWGKSGENLCALVTKGSHIWASGRLEMRKQENGGYWVDVRDAEWGFVTPKPSSQEALDESQRLELVEA